MGILFMSWSAFYFIRDWHGFLWFRPPRSPACLKKIVCFAALSKKYRRCWHCQKSVGRPCTVSKVLSCWQNIVCLCCFCQRTVCRAELLEKCKTCLTLGKLSAFLYCQKVFCLAALSENCLPCCTVRKMSAFCTVRKLHVLVNNKKIYLPCCTVRKLSVLLHRQKVPRLLDVLLEGCIVKIVYGFLK